MTKKVVLYGAFDRYNYGDNLMPIVFVEYMKKFHVDIIDEFSFIYSSISDSDLSHYGCEKSIAIKKVYNKLGAGDSIIVTGGDVLCADTPDLFFHVQNNEKMVMLYKMIRKLSHELYNKIARQLYCVPWSYPYIINPTKINKDVKICYNTVGGSFRHLNQKNYDEISFRIKEASFLSVRNEELFEESLMIKTESILSPDSVYIIERLFDDSFFEKKISNKFKCFSGYKYIVFQSAPDKLGDSVKNTVENLKILSKKHKCKIILLPIGYASEHADIDILNEIRKESRNEFELLSELNIWEIMYILKNSSMYIGTSLHGVITAMSYGIPHFGINPKVEKLDRFLKSWSVSPFNRCYKVSDIASLSEIFNNEDIKEFRIRSEMTKDMVVNNNNRIIDFINN